MNNRELLELAAKAAGIEVWFPRMADGKGGVIEPCHRKDIANGGVTVEWNPLTDDGDALRLAVKLRLSVALFDGFNQVQVCNKRGKEVSHEQYGDDVQAATRRAIVRAAAEIGRGME